MRFLRPLLFAVLFSALAAGGAIVGQTLYPDSHDTAIAEVTDRPLVDDNPRSFEHEMIGTLGSRARDDFLELVRREAASAPLLESVEFRTLLDEAFAFTALGDPLRIERIEHGPRFGRYRLSTHRVVFGVHGAEVGWTVRRFRNVEAEASDPVHSQAIFILPGAKADMAAMLDQAQPDFMNQLAVRASGQADVFILDPLTDLRAAADANAKLTMVGRQLEGLRARALCDVAAQVAPDYPDGLLMWGVRDGARTAEIVNVLCETEFRRVAVDALPVPLDTSLAQRFLALTIGEIGALQTVGPFWGRHSWTDFAAAARNQTVYFLTRTDIAAAQVWLDSSPLEEDAPLATMIEKEAEYGGAEFGRLGGFVSGAEFGRNEAYILE